MRKVTVAAIQMACSPDAAENRRTAEAMVRRAAGNGAQIILLPELFETPYFCQERRYASYELATTPAENPAIAQLRKVAAELQVVLPVSFYEKAGTALYNSIAIIDADGSVLGIYRKTHIPDDHFYQEKFYFTPGDTGFKVWNTRYARIGVGICWDQWFPEAARCMALAGAELLFYPTAIGSEPILEVDSAPHWQRCMQGHAAANLMPVIAANRIGTEHITPDEENQQQTSSLSFYGTSFLTDGTGAVLQQLGRDEAGIAMQTYDLDELEEMRMSWGVFRDRRPEYYRAISTPPTVAERRRQAPDSVLLPTFHFVIANIRNKIVKKIVQNGRVQQMLFVQCAENSTVFSNKTANRLTAPQNIGIINSGFMTNRLQSAGKFCRLHTNADDSDCKMETAIAQKETPPYRRQFPDTKGRETNGATDAQTSLCCSRRTARFSDDRHNFRSSRRV